VNAVLTSANAPSSNPELLTYNKAVNGTAIKDPFPLLTKVLKAVPIFLVTWANATPPSLN